MRKRPNSRQSSRETVATGVVKAGLFSEAELIIAVWNHLYVKKQWTPNTKNGEQVKWKPSMLGLNGGERQRYGTTYT